MHTNKQLEVSPSSLVNGIVVLDARHEAWRKRCLEIGRSHSESLFYFVPQEKNITKNITVKLARLGADRTDVAAIYTL